MRTGSAIGRSTSGMMARGLFLISATVALAACNGSTGEMGLAVGEKVIAPSGAPIAVESLSGGPEGLRTKFASALSQEASERKIELVGAGGAKPAPGTASPRYRVRGYLDAYPTDDGKIAFSYVWDVYDTTRQRAQRVEGAAQIRGSAADPWGAVDEAALKLVAAKSMNDIAGFLVAAGPASGSTKVATAARGKPGSAKPLAYAPTEE
ncbi:MAG: hypothetical protein ABWZ80_00945 [Beijerinckiaceae bacterium]